MASIRAFSIARRERLVLPGEAIRARAQIGVVTVARGTLSSAWGRRYGLL